MPWLRALLRADVPSQELDSIRRANADAYDLVDELPRGPARLAAWSAYALQTYGDKLIAASQTEYHVRADTAHLARGLYQLAATCLECARDAASDPARPLRRDLPARLPHWHTAIRAHEQLVGMRGALDALRVYIAYDLESGAEDDASLRGMREGLAAIDAKLETVDRLWIVRPPAALRGGIGDALTTGLDQAYELGGLLAAGPRR